MHTIGAFEAKTHFSALLEEVEKGERVIITKHGHPVAKLVPTKEIGKVELEEVIKQLKIFNKNHTLGGINWKELRDEGHR